MKKDSSQLVEESFSDKMEERQKMKTYTCINKIRDNNNIIKQYVLKDIQTHDEYTVPGAGVDWGNLW